MTSADKQYVVVVGVDGSPSSKAALRWAAWHARLAGGSVVALTAWNTSTVYSDRIAAGADYERLLTNALSELVGEIVGEVPVNVQQRVVRDHPARALLSAVADPDLLVVGNRGHGGFTEAMLGSVGQYCVHHATCPVVVVRE
ncbi:nucleotide-binding universal stress UspA family protein [Saccharopolyspora erythraea NRRL 2338]|uniref:Stress-inducible protein n=2 Tax=Saccharopolyspora erythraea TaxID=1836 RepID=A4FIB4_SACEN|nr:universal stress protein [Saccharopolyspora erythraea]EQD87448.1 stress-inducible protein [Saccharopolyspora erythraea D]PFG97467.1 nucleotide-binding universal stress UspA family protein [Saccharopolyspora erythraea NRRL 2338]QRK87645.1 universal stress protein [Saccharopolyspora erythraea]CAM03789.1 stress-inducible protein [Saccharopolyspora erythraea NRRL 2338]